MQHPKFGAVRRRSKKWAETDDVWWPTGGRRSDELAETARVRRCVERDARPAAAESLELGSIGRPRPMVRDRVVVVTPSRVTAPAASRSRSSSPSRPSVLLFSPGDGRHSLAAASTARGFVSWCAGRGGGFLDERSRRLSFGSRSCVAIEWFGNDGLLLGRNTRRCVTSAALKLIDRSLSDARADITAHCDAPSRSAFCAAGAWDWEAQDGGANDSRQERGAPSHAGAGGGGGSTATAPRVEPEDHAEDQQHKQQRTPGELERAVASGRGSSDLCGDGRRCTQEQWRAGLCRRRHRRL